MSLLCKSHTSIISNEYKNINFQKDTLGSTGPKMLCPQVLNDHGVSCIFCDTEIYFKLKFRNSQQEYFL